MYVTDLRVQRLELPPTDEQRAAEQQAAIEKLATWVSKRAELLVLLVTAVDAQNTHAGAVSALLDECRQIRSGPRDDLFLDEFGNVGEGVSQEKLTRYAQLAQEIEKREQLYAAWVAEPQVRRLGWDRVGRPGYWSTRRVSDIERQLRDCDRAILWVEQEAGCPRPLT